MPTYQYSCTECGHDLEIVQSFSEDSLTVCPECEGRLRKIFNAVGVVFKGSGFYRTDSRKQGSGAEVAATGKETASKTESAPKADAPKPAAAGAGSSTSTAAASA